ncbi:MAG TPA: TIGR03364 family FAD-dependent oxidoreductase [Acidimicrobiales bacterium]|nr:TIGR03364 family FAD-dependent oxidoreductase [Acidimicrobiales bacterium]
MTTGAPRLVVVGGGILGTMHAVEGARRGFEVVQLDRDAVPRGASVRNFGLVWVSGRAAGPELELALRARERWEEIARLAPAIGFRAAGSLTIARVPAEMAVIEEAVGRPDSGARGLSILTAAQVRATFPAITGEVLAALRCTRDAIVEPRSVLGALRGALEGSAAYTWLPGAHAVEVRDHAVRDHRGEWHDGDLVVCCPGAYPGAFLADQLAVAPLRRVRLQMIETEPFATEVTTAVADGDSFRYYPAYGGRARKGLPPQADVAARWSAQLLLVQRATGHLTIGDTHAYDEPSSFDISDEPSRHLVASAAAILGGTLPAVERRWDGVYVEATAGGLYHRVAVAPGVVVVTGAGGRGMTLAPAIAEESFA